MQIYAELLNGTFVLSNCFWGRRGLCIIFGIHLPQHGAASTFVTTVIAVTTTITGIGQRSSPNWITPSTAFRSPQCASDGAGVVSSKFTSTWSLVGESMETVAAT